MQQSKRNKSIYGWFVLKMILAAAAFWFIYHRITGRDELYLEELKSALSTPSLGWQLALIFVLMFFNWLVEAWKWKLMMAKLEELSIFRSLEAVFSGLSISLFTPNRIGEYAGRVFHLEKADKIQATIITVIENFSQLLVTFVIGCVAMMIFLQSIRQ
ncbi:MAG: flippase-like domain-containing protein [Bacteroidetes bacterium]|nr:flippase-like domain-containing protein [Bacteroidota bacterium]